MPAWCRNMLTTTNKPQLNELLQVVLKRCKLQWYMMQKKKSKLQLVEVCRLFWKHKRDSTQTFACRKTLGILFRWRLASCKSIRCKNLLQKESECCWAFSFDMRSAWVQSWLVNHLSPSRQCDREGLMLCAKVPLGLTSHILECSSCGPATAEDDSGVPGSS